MPALVARNLAAARPLLTRAVMVLALSLVLAISARIQVPFWPVPMTLQTLAVLGIAGLAGPTIAGAAMLAYLAEGAFGMPVFAGTPQHGLGIAYLAGPTGGYLVGMLLAAVVVGALARRSATRPLLLGATMFAGVGIIYLAGAAWLTRFVGLEQVVPLGIAPFLVGDAVKATLAVALVLVAGGIPRRA